MADTDQALLLVSSAAEVLTEDIRVKPVVYKGLWPHIALTGSDGSEVFGGQSAGDSGLGSKSENYTT